jgi:hypothetical protein
MANVKEVGGSSYPPSVFLRGDTWWCRWLRRATSWTVTSSRSDEVVEFIRFSKSFQMHHSASNINEYQKIFLEVKRDRHVRLTALPPSVSRLSRQRGILDTSQPCRLPWRVTGIALLFYITFTFLPTTHSWSLGTHFFLTLSSVESSDRPQCYSQ